MVQGLIMTHDLYLRLYQTPEQRRRAGARGGRASARNQRSHRRATAAPLPTAVAIGKPHAETTAEAIAALDSQFFWLRGVEKCRRPTPAPSLTVLVAN